MLLVSDPQPGVRELRLNRPQQLNALTFALTRELVVALRHAELDASVRVVVLTAEGRGFCAGKDRNDPATPEFVHLLQSIAGQVMGMTKPVVATVQGWAVGAGVEILLNCDIVIAARNARFKLPEITIGLFGTGGVLALLPRAIGIPKAKGALMLGEEFSAEEAERWGLIWKVVEDTQLRAEADAIATRLAGSPPAVLAEIKRAVHRESVDLAAVLQREAESHGRLLPP